MLCLPALTPVANEAHAVGDSGECVVCSGNMPPPFASFAMLGSLPSSIHCVRRCGSMPSKPRMTSFWLYFDAPRRAVPEQAIENAVRPTTTSARAFRGFDMELLRIIACDGCKLRAMEPVLRDFRLALRRLWMAPGFTLFSVASLALGIGVPTATYSAVRTFFGMPLGVPHQEELVGVTDGQIVSPAMAWPDFVDLRARQSSFMTLAALRPITVALAASETAEPVFGGGVSGDYFSVMGALPRAGRLIQMQDDAAATRVAVVSERVWRSRVYGDLSILGQTIKLGGQPFEVIGITRGPFHGIERFLEQSVWIPITAAAQSSEAFGPARDLGERRRSSVQVWGRLKGGVALARANSETALIGRRLDESFPKGDRRVRVWGLKQNASEFAVSGTTNTIPGMILTAFVLVLLIACSNLANLSLARGTARSQETSVRSALGASRWRLVREQLIEGAIVTVLGAACGGLVLTGLTDYLSTDLPLGRGIAVPFRPIVDGSALVTASPGIRGS